MSWESRSLKDCVTFFSGGTPRKGNPEFWGGEVPWVSSAEMTERFLDDTTLRITRAGLEAGSRLAPEGTTFAVVRGMSLAKEFRISLALRSMAFNQDVKALIPKEGVDGKFVFCSLSANANAIRDLATEAAHGTKKLEMNRLENFEIKVPVDIEVQKQAASVALAYDDLIATNQRRIALLEEAARRLYREWFVHLRFPGHQTVKVVDGVPEGWRQKPIGELFDYHIGGGWGKEDADGMASDAAFVIRGTDIPKLRLGAKADVPLRFHPAKNLASRKLQSGDLIFEASGGSRDQGVGRLLAVTDMLLSNFVGPAMCASFCKLIRPTQGASEYLALMIDDLRETEGLRAFEKQSASNIVNFAFSEFCERQLALKPPQVMLEYFRAAIQPIWEQIAVFGQQQVKLAKARDALLPKLMRGELDVSGIQLPERQPDAA